MKSWYNSKTVWFNVIMTVLDIAAFLQITYPTNEKIGVASILAHGIGNIILRVWFTDQAVS